jgi:hypothetical protein
MIAAGVTPATAQLIRGLIDRQAAGSFTLTDQGRAVLEALMMRAATRSWQRRSGVIGDLMSAKRRRAYALIDQARALAASLARS